MKVGQNNGPGIDLKKASETSSGNFRRYAVCPM
uniref:Uncharacterized protein n=1 Tax=Arundo donax TaxID=35708 RepID=A0A0A9H3L3_ARUDO